MEKIIRQFKVLRGDREIIYPFTTYPIIFLRNFYEENSPLGKLTNHLRETFMNGVPSEDKKSVTELSPVVVAVKKRESELVEFAKKADYRNRQNQQHACVQNHLLDFDSKTIAIEIPVWDELTMGHIDIIRVVGDKIQVVDFKPNAHKETKAGSQVLRYILLLMKHLDLPMRIFEGVYFDDCNAYFLEL